MSSKNNFSLFPELNALKRTLWEVQGEFAETKPRLDAKLASLKPKSDSPLDELEAAARLELINDIPEDLADTISKARDVYATVDAFLGDKENRVALSLGQADEEAIGLVLPLWGDNYYALNTLFDLIPTLSYGAEAIEQTHILETRVGLQNILLNRLFEMFDLRPGLVDENSQFARYMIGIVARMGVYARESAMQPTWDLLSAWMSRWGDGRMLRAAVQAHIPVGEIEMNPPRNIDNYASGDVLLKVNLFFGNLFKVEVAKGFLPLGLILDRGKGEIRIGDPDKLFPGEFSGLSLRVENDEGFGGELALDDIVFGQDFEATYTVFSPKQLDKISEGEMLAYPTDPDGTMVGAQIVAGTFPPGAKFDTQSGELTLHDLSRVVAGTYKLAVMTVDAKGGRTNHEFEIEFVAPPEVAARYKSQEHFPLPLFKGDVLGAPELSNGFVTGAARLSGSIPPGTSLLKSGILMVMEPEMLREGTYMLRVSLATSIGPVLEADLKIEIAPEKTTARK